jgi:phytoene synthase
VKENEATGHPVADAFGEIMRRRSLAPDRIAGLIDARAFDVERNIMPDWSSLDVYLGDTAGALFALGAACGGASGASVESAASQAGLAYGLTGLMRALPVHAASGRVYLSAEALARHGTSPEAVLAGKTEDGLRALLAELRQQARKALAEARRQVAELEPPAQAAFLPLCLVEPYLDSLEKSRDPVREIAGINPLHRLWRMARWRW